MKLIRQTPRGFTLIELLVVISIVGLLSSVVLASLTVARDRARVGSALLFDSTNYHAFGADAQAHLDFDSGTGIPTTGSVGTYTMDARDCDPLYGGDATCLGAYTNDTPSGQGRSFTFGDSSRPIWANLSSAVQMNNYTLSVWIKIPVTDTNALITGSCTSTCPTNSGAAVFKIYLINGSGNQYAIHTGSANEYVDTSATFDLNKWYLITVSYVGATNKYMIYIDGKRIPDNQITISAPLGNGGFPPDNNFFDTLTLNNPFNSLPKTIIIDNLSVYPYSLGSN